MPLKIVHNIMYNHIYPKNAGIVLPRGKWSTETLVIMSAVMPEHETNLPKNSVNVSH